MKKGLISVILPCFNVSPWLDDCFKSLENQTYKNTEFIFVNDGSKDDTLAKIKEFCKGKKNCKIVDQENKGVSASRNIGIAQAEGEFLYFFDADDLMLPTLLETLHNLMETKQVDCSICRFKLESESIHFEDLKTERNKQYKVEEISGTNRLLKLLVNYRKFGHAVWSNLYRHSKIKEMENYPNVFDVNMKYSEDLDFNFRFFTKLDKVAFCREKLYVYRQRNNSAMHEEFSPVKIESLKSFDNAIELCKGELKPAKHTVILRKFDRYDMLLNQVVRDKYKDKEIIKNLLKEHRQIIPKTCHPILYIVHLYYLIRLAGVLLSKDKKD